MSKGKFETPPQRFVGITLVAFAPCEQYENKDGIFIQKLLHGLLPKAEIEKALKIKKEHESEK